MYYNVLYYIIVYHIIVWYVVLHVRLYYIIRNDHALHDNIAYGVVTCYMIFYNVTWFPKSNIQSLKHGNRMKWKICEPLLWDFLLSK